MGIVQNITDALEPAEEKFDLSELVSTKEQPAPPSRWFLRLAYRGAPFHGWQRQPNAPSVQQTIEEALSKILRREINITGAGRTDTGVNAAEMFAHFDYPGQLPAKDKFLRSLNLMVGRDIAIYDLIPVAPDAHARFDAVARTYKYFVNTTKNPFNYPLSWLASGPLDIEAMNEAAEILRETDDFTSFAKLHTDNKTNICRVTHARWEQEGEQLVFTITADRFLRNMVRAVVGTLVDVGRGKLTLGQFREIIARKDRCAASTSMPGEALFLWRVEYPYI